MQKLFIIIAAFCSLFFLSACERDDSVPVEVYLPAGDASRGQEHFVTLGCVNCHTVTGADLPEPEARGPVRVRLGSRTGKTMSYGKLVTAVVNPSHKLAARYRDDEVSEDGKSLMTVYNDVMTVTQLTDIVAFLEAHYEKAERPGYKYPTYTDMSDEASETKDP